MTKKEGSKFLVLSPGDLVYSYGDINELSQINWSNLNHLEIQNVYLMEKATGTSCYFLPFEVSNLIAKGEFESSGKSEKKKLKTDQKVIKSSCIKLKIDRLGKITPIYPY